MVTNGRWGWSTTDLSTLLLPLFCTCCWSPNVCLVSRYANFGIRWHLSDEEKQMRDGASDEFKRVGEWDTWEDGPLCKQFLRRCRNLGKFWRERCCVRQYIWYSCVDLNTSEVFYSYFVIHLRDREHVTSYRSKFSGLRWVSENGEFLSDTW